MRFSQVLVSSDEVRAACCSAKEVIKLNQTIAAPNEESRHAVNVIAAVLSTVWPGLGQLYQGHIASGLIWMLAGMPLALDWDPA